MSLPSSASIARLHTPDTALCGKIGAAADEAVSAVEKDGWRARHDTPRVPIPTATDDWSADPFQDRNWTFQLHAWRPVGPFIVAHHRLGDHGLLERAAGVMLNWRDAEATADDDGLFWNDMGTGLRAAKLAYVLAHGPTAGLAADLVEALTDLGRLHMSRLADPDFLGDSNHAFFQVHGLMALVNALPPSEETKAAQRYAEAALERLLASQFGSEGMHLEHSPGYHLFATRTLRRMLSSGWYSDATGFKSLLARADDAFRWLVFPDGHLPAVGDTDRGGRRYSYKPAGDRTARLFGEAGYAIVRHSSGAPSSEAMLFVSAGHHGQVHKHADDLSFELYEKGRYWFVDTGKYSYSRADWRSFTDSARAHNTLVYSGDFENNGVRRSLPVGGSLTSLTDTGETFVVEGRVERPVIGAVHERRFVYSPGKSLLIEDRLSLDKEREVWHWLHLAPDLDASPTPTGWRVQGLSIDYQIENGGGDRPVKVRGQTEPDIQGWIAEGYHRITPNDALGLKVTGRQIAISTRITFDP